MPTDTEALSKLLGSLYDAATDPSLWDPFLQQLAESTEARSANLMMHSFGLDKYTIYSSWELDPEANRLYQEHYGAIDIWGQRGLSILAGRVCNSEELSPLAELSTTEIYNDFLARFGIEHGLFGVAVNSGSRWASVGLYRDSTGSAFGDCELETLRFLAPHLERTFKLHFQFSELHARSEGLETAFDMLPTGVIFFGQKGEVVLMNRSALASVSERDGLLATRDGIRAERLAESALLEKTILQAASTLNGNGFSAGGTVLISRRLRPPLQIQISPIRNTVIQTSQPIAAVAFVNDPLRTHRPTQELLRLLYGLTPAECRVALLLGDVFAFSGNGSRRSRAVSYSFEVEFTHNWD